MPAVVVMMVITIMVIDDVDDVDVADDDEVSVAVTMNVILSS